MVRQLLLVALVWTGAGVLAVSGWSLIKADRELAYQEELARQMNAEYRYNELLSHVKGMSRRIEFLEHQYDQITAASRMSWAQAYRFLRHAPLAIREGI